MVNIDCNYIKRVKDYMAVKLPKPRKKNDFLMDGDVKIPIICVECEI